MPIGFHRIRGVTKPAWRRDGLGVGEPYVPGGVIPGVEDWVMGVAARINNHSFRDGRNVVTALSLDEAVGSTVINISGTTPAFNRLVRDGAAVRFGPSTDSSYYGLSEVKYIDSVYGGGLGFSITAGLTNAYKSGDQIWVYGDRLAGGWGDVAHTGLLVAFPQDTFGGFDDPGIDNLWRQKWYIDPVFQGFLQQYIPDTLIDSAVYRILLYYKQSGPSRTCAVNVKGGSSPTTFISGTLPSSAAWRVWTAAGTSPADASIYDCLVGFDVEYPPGSDLYIWLDQVVLQHAHRVASASGGFYTFSEKPDLGSVQIDRVPGTASLRLGNGNSRYFDRYGDRGKNLKWTISAQFSIVPESFWQSIQDLLQWQRRGSLLTLAPDIDDVPSILVGTLGIKEMAKRHWDFDRHSFNVIFQEA